MKQIIFTCFYFTMIHVQGEFHNIGQLAYHKIDFGPTRVWN